MYAHIIRQVFLTSALLLGGLGLACAQEAIGTVTFLTGQAQLQRAGQTTPLTKGQSLQVGDRIVTGSSGHVHARMVDQGFISVRPSARLHIQSYTYNPQNPQANRVGLLLESGVARTISGKAGEAAREHYRFNTPVAAIGLRGTDYVVQALPDVTRVSVLKGAVTLSAFGPGCASDNLAPCTGPLVRELVAGNPHAYLEVRAKGGLPTIVLPEQGKDAPNKLSPPRPEEIGSLPTPLTNPVVVTQAQAQAELEAQARAKAQAEAEANALAAAQAKAQAEADALAAAQAEAAARANAAAEAQAAAQAEAERAAAAQAAAQAEADALARAQAAAEALAREQAAANAMPPEIIWGRWSTVDLPSTPTITSVSAADREITFSNDLFGLLRPKGAYQFPSAGVISMRYLQGEAYLQDTGAAQSLTPATLANASLSLDFNTHQFATQLNASAAGATYNLHAQGSIDTKGLLLVDASRSNTNVLGALSNNAQEAGYLFNVNVAPSQNLVGATRWGR